MVSELQNGKRVLTVDEWSDVRKNAEIEALTQKVNTTSDEQVKLRCVEIISKIQQNTATLEEVEMAKNIKTKPSKTNGNIAQPAKTKAAKVKTEGPSRADLIEKALQKGGSLESVVSEVNKQIPDTDSRRIGMQVNAIVRDVRQKRGRWKDYTFVEKDFKIVKG